MANARHLCKIYDEDGHAVVECKPNLPNDRRLQFATVIADADAVLTGQTRNIYFYVGSQQFAQADPLRGVRLK